MKGIKATCRETTVVIKSHEDFPLTWTDSSQMEAQVNELGEAMDPEVIKKKYFLLFNRCRKEIRKKWRGLEIFLEFNVGN